MIWRFLAKKIIPCERFVQNAQVTKNSTEFCADNTVIHPAGMVACAINLNATRKLNLLNIDCSLIQTKKCP